MLKIGTQGIAAMRLGAQEIKKAYLGGALVFGAGEGPGPSRLPEGYTEVEYIESDKNCLIDTEIRAAANEKPDVKVAIDVEPIDDPTSTSSYFIYSVYTVTSPSIKSYYYTINWKTTSGVYAQLSSNAEKSVLANTTPRRMNMELDGSNHTFTLDGKSVSLGTTSSMGSTTGGYIYIFGNLNTTLSNFRIRAKLYSCKIYKGSDYPLVRDFVPCIDPTGAVGLYDLVGGEFYGNSGTGTLTAGPAV